MLARLTLITWGVHYIPRVWFAHTLCFSFKTFSGTLILSVTGNGSCLSSYHFLKPPYLHHSSKLSATCANEARAAVLSFFHAPPGYTVIFTANATGALKLVGESFPFEARSTYVLGADSHNSVHGIREFASRSGAKVCYINSTQNGGFVKSIAEVSWLHIVMYGRSSYFSHANTNKSILMHNRPTSSTNNAPSLFALTGQSNISNSKNPLSMIEYASSLGYYTLLDAAALAPSSSFFLSDHPQLDAMAISFYKMFGFPTGVGALIVKKSFLSQLNRPWFAGGNVDVVQVPGNLVTRSYELHEQFEVRSILFSFLPNCLTNSRFVGRHK